MTTRHTTLFLVGISTLLISCSSTSVKTTWKSPDYTGGAVGPVGVLAVEERGIVRVGLENRFARELRSDNQAAVVTHEFLSLREIKENREEAAKQLREAGAVTVLITRLVTREIQARSVRAGNEDYAAVTTGFSPGLPYGPYDWYGYYSVAFQDMSTVWSSQSKQIYLETSLFSLTGGQRIWSCLTDTRLTETSDSLEEMDKLAVKIVGAMRKDGLLQ